MSNPNDICLCGHKRSKHTIGICMHGHGTPEACDCQEFRPAEPAPESEPNALIHIAFGAGIPLHQKDENMETNEELTSEQMRVEIAAFCGWRYWEDDSHTHFHWTSPEDNGQGRGKAYDEVPDFPCSLDVMTTAAATLTDEEWKDYLDILAEGSVTPYEPLRLCAQAAALQRARAFLAVKKGASK